MDPTPTPGFSVGPSPPGRAAATTMTTVATAPRVLCAPPVPASNRIPSASARRSCCCLQRGCRPVVAVISPGALALRLVGAVAVAVVLDYFHHICGAVSVVCLPPPPPLLLALTLHPPRLPRRCVTRRHLPPSSATPVVPSAPFPEDSPSPEVDAPLVPLTSPELPSVSSPHSSSPPVLHAITPPRCVGS